MLFRYSDIFFRQQRDLLTVILISPCDCIKQVDFCSVSRKFGPVPDMTKLTTHATKIDFVLVTSYAIVFVYLP